MADGSQRLTPAARRRQRRRRWQGVHELLAGGGSGSTCGLWPVVGALKLFVAALEAQLGASVAAMASASDERGCEDMSMEVVEHNSDGSRKWGEPLGTDPPAENPAALQAACSEEIEDLCPASHNLDVPLVKSTGYQVLSAVAVTGEMSSTEDDLNLPTFVKIGEPTDDDKRNVVVGAAELQRREAEAAESQRRDAEAAELQCREAEAAELQRRDAEAAELQRREAEASERQRREAVAAELQRHEAEAAELQRREAVAAELQRRDAGAGAVGEAAGTAGSAGFEHPGGEGRHLARRGPEAAEDDARRADEERFAREAEALEAAWRAEDERQAEEERQAREAVWQAACGTRRARSRARSARRAARRAEEERSASEAADLEAARRAEVERQVREAAEAAARRAEEERLAREVEELPMRGAFLKMYEDGSKACMQHCFWPIVEVRQVKQVGAMLLVLVSDGEYIAKMAVVPSIAFASEVDRQRFNQGVLTRLMGYSWEDAGKKRLIVSRLEVLGMLPERFRSPDHLLKKFSPEGCVDLLMGSSRRGADEEAAGSAGSAGFEHPGGEGRSLQRPGACHGGASEFFGRAVGQLAAAG